MIYGGKSKISCIEVLDSSFEGRLTIISYRKFLDPYRMSNLIVYSLVYSTI
jgi:hypothetical protein